MVTPQTEHDYERFRVGLASRQDYRRLINSAIELKEEEA
jgi:hypothetical protein